MARDFPQYYQGDLVSTVASPHVLGTVEYTAWEAGDEDDDGDDGGAFGGDGDSSRDNVVITDGPASRVSSMVERSAGGEGDDEGDVDDALADAGEFDDGYEGDEDDEEDIPLADGEVAVYMKGEMKPLHHSELRLVDRSISAGSPVAWATRPLTSYGVVTNAKVYCDIVFEFPVKKKAKPTKGAPPKRFIVLPCVPSFILQRVHVWGRANVYAALDDHSRVGTALSGTTVVTVRFAPKLVAVISQPDLDDVEPVQRKSGLEPEDADMFYYPGLVVDVARAALASRATWLQGTAMQALALMKGRRTLRGAVTECGTKSVEMQWVAVRDAAASSDQQEENVSPARLVDIDPFDHVYTELNDRVYLPAKYRSRFAKLYAGDSAAEWVRAVADFEGVEYPFDPRSVHNLETRVLFGDDAADAEEEEAAAAAAAAAAGAGDGEGADADADAAAGGGDDDDEEDDEPKPKKAAGGKKGSAAGAGAKKAPAKTTEELNTCWRLGIARVFKTRTVADVLWQDGTVQREVPTVDLIPRDQLQDFDHCAMDFVEARRDILRAGARAPLPGYVVAADAAEQTVRVRWIRAWNDIDAPPTDADTAPSAAAAATVAPTSVSEWRAQLEARAAAEGCTVRDTQFGNNNVPTTEPGVMDVDTTAYEVTVVDGQTYVTTPAEELSVYDVRTAAQEVNIGDFVVRLMPVDGFADTTEWIGCIVAIEHGYLLVKWSQGTFSRTRPWEVYVISNESTEINEDNAAAAEAADRAKEAAELKAATEASAAETAGAAAAAAAKPAAAEEDTPEAGAASAEPEEPAAEAVNDDDDAAPFGGFDTTDAPRPVTVCAAPTISPALARRVRSEWRQLAGACPPGVRVLAYEQALDVLTVAIAGPEGTPYAHGVYLFDITLPAAYPAEAPKVHFTSLGLRIHPNLYETGRVCLSLLGTWDGHGSQNWNPEHSNLQQVILSLQGLVIGLNEPYYNEAGYDKFRGTRQAAVSSIAYNEQAMLLSLTMLARFIAQPPTAVVRGAVLAHARAARDKLRELISLPIPPLAAAALSGAGGEEEKTLSRADITARHAALTPEQQRVRAIFAQWGLPPQLDVGVGEFATAEELAGRLYYPSKGFTLQFAQVRAKLDAALKARGL
jgi:ubiquitin-protein ligase